MNADGYLLGDALELIKDVPDCSVDLLVLDPNYQDWDDLCNNGILLESIRVLKETGNIICFTKQPFDFNLRNAVNPYIRREICWSFSNGGAWVSNRMPLVSFQKLFWLVKSKDFYINVRTGIPYNESTKDFKRGSKVFGGYNEDGKQFSRSDEGTWIRDHYHFNKPCCGRIPQKPKELVEILINCFCQEGGLVLDPFAGSGIVHRTAIEKGRRAISFEIDKETYLKYKYES